VGQNGDPQRVTNQFALASYLIAVLVGDDHTKAHNLLNSQKVMLHLDCAQEHRIKQLVNFKLMFWIFWVIVKRAS
jgi:hypothetical protein